MAEMMTTTVAGVAGAAAAEAAAAAEEEEAEAEAEAKASLRPGLEAMQRFQEAVGVAGVRPDLVAVRAWLRGLPPAQVKRMLLLTAPTRYLLSHLPRPLCR